MAIDSQDMELSEDDKELLRRAENSSGKPWRTLLRELLGPILGPRPSSLAAWQRKNGIELFERLAKHPGKSPDDGICASVDHDKILYGDK